MTNDSRPYPVVSNQSMVLFSTVAGVEGIAYSNIVDTPVVGPVLSLCKSADKIRASLGETVVYTIIAKNNGNTAADLTVYDTLPEGVSFIINSVLRDGILIPEANPFSGIHLGSVAPETQVTISFQVIIVSIPPSLTLVNKSLCIFSFMTPEGRLITDELFSNTVTISLYGYQISTYLSANTSTTFVGDVVTYTLRIMNEGIQSLLDITAVIQIPEGALFLAGSVIVAGVHYPEAVPSQGIVLGNLSSRATIELSFRVSIITVPPTSELTNQALVSYIVDEAQHNTDSNIVVIAVVQPEVTICKKVDLSMAAPGDRLRYELTVKNNGNLPVDAMLIDAIPLGTLFVWDSVVVNGVVKKGVRPEDGISLSKLRIGSETIVEFSVTIPSSMDIHKVTSIHNQGSVQYTFLLPDGRTVRQISRSNVVTTLLFAPCISLDCCVEPTMVEVGGIVAFKILLTNSGNHPAESSLIHLAPEGASLNSHTITIDGSSSPQSYSNDTLTLGTIYANTTVCICFFVKVNKYWISGFLKGFSTARYHFSLDGRDYTGEVRSNSYMITLEEFSE